MIAINDSFLLVSIVFQLIRNHFHGEDYYADLIDLFRDVSDSRNILILSLKFISIVGD